MAHVTRPRKTLEDYRALADDVRAELIGGDLYVTPAPGDRHQAVALNLTLALATHVRARALGHFAFAPRDVYLPTGDVVQPDLLFVAERNSAICREDAVHGAPDLVIEILSLANAERDRIVKREVYARGGVPEYWIVDPEARGIEIFRLEDGAYRSSEWLTGDAVVTTSALPGLRLGLDTVFA